MYGQYSRAVSGQERVIVARVRYLFRRKTRLQHLRISRYRYIYNYTYLCKTLVDLQQNEKWSSFRNCIVLMHELSVAYSLISSFVSAIIAPQKTVPSYTFFSFTKCDTAFQIWSRKGQFAQEADNSIFLIVSLQRDPQNAKIYS